MLAHQMLIAANRVLPADRQIFSRFELEGYVIAQKLGEKSVTVLWQHMDHETAVRSAIAKLVLKEPDDAVASALRGLIA